MCLALQLINDADDFFSSGFLPSFNRLDCLRPCQLQPRVAQLHALSLLDRKRCFGALAGVQCFTFGNRRQNRDGELVSIC